MSALTSGGAVTARRDTVSGEMQQAESPVRRRRSASRFSWGLVDVHLRRELLLAVYGAEEDRDDDLARLEVLDDDALAEQATAVFGASIPSAWHALAVPIVVERWLASADESTLRPLATVCQLVSVGEPRTRAVSTAGEAVDLLRQLQAHPVVAANILSAFHRGHRVRYEVEVVPTVRVERRLGQVPLSGRSVLDRRRPYDHQRKAWQQLDAFAAERCAVRGGLLVLPTGAGKTFTMVHWLLGRLAADDDLRVLWLADQREIVDQAARAFEAQAAHQRWGFSRQMRVVHGLADVPTTLADPGADVLCATRQSVLGQNNHQTRKRLEALLSRPTIVVIDEAHHAVADGYRSLVAEVRRVQPDAAIIGLTATPWPMGEGRVALLESLFPRRVANVQIRDLVASGVLARPTFHTVETHQHLDLTAAEVKQAVSSDISAAVLGRLNLLTRNETIVQRWAERQDVWGKTLVFACDIAHADDLATMFRRRRIDVDVVHSAVDELPGDVIARFREASGPRVLVSVGMLLEGVDIPDARTAVLARPTTSRVLLRQMIGRVLRGPEGGGEAVAHIIDVRDSWDSQIDVLSPVEVLPGDVDSGDDDHPSRRLPRVRDADTGQPLSEDIIRRIQKAFEEVAPSTVPLPLVDSELVGFYDLDDLKVPVFDHTAQRWQDLISSLLRKTNEFKWPMASFEDLSIPRPVPSDIRAVADFVASTHRAPPLVPVRVRVSVRDVAEDLEAAPPMRQAEVRDWLLKRYEESLMRSAFSSFQAFYEAVQAELLTGTDGVGVNPEKVIPESPTSGLPKLRRRSDRALEPIFDRTVQKGRLLLLESGEYDYADLLRRDYVPKARWTNRVGRGAWAYWSVHAAGPWRGHAVIRVNKVLQAPTTEVSDDLLQYLLWHELCHHLTPGRQHDSEFRRLEALWPGGAVLDHELDTLHERYDLRLPTSQVTRNPSTPDRPAVTDAAPPTSLPTLRALVRGEVRTLPSLSTAWTVSLTWAATETEPDVVAFLTGPDEQVLSDDDFVFYNHPSTSTGSVHLSTAPGMATLRVELGALDEVHSQVLIALCGDSGQTLETVGPVGIAVDDGAAHHLSSVTDAAAAESSLYLIAFTRRGHAWRARIIGQGDAKTLHQLAVHHGVDVT